MPRSCRPLLRRVTKQEVDIFMGYTDRVSYNIGFLQFDVVDRDYLVHLYAPDSTAD